MTTETDLAPAGAPRRAGNGPPAGTRLLHMIGNAHIDPVWLWRWPDGLHEVRATFASALALMEEYPELVFTCDSVAYLAWIEEVDPGLFAAIGRRVAEGRFCVVGGWWIEPDCNIPSGESFVRQGLYGQRFLAQHFGSAATSGCNVDPFGHCATLPQILAKSGMDSYAFLRPEPKEKDLPGECFWWAARDGSRVLAYRIPYGYTGPAGDLERFVDRVLERFPAGAGGLMVFYGVGNHGGGPTRANLDSIRRLDEERAGLSLRCSTMRRYFDDVIAGGAALPTYTGDLQHHAVGCYSAHSGVKRWNRRAESMLGRAEKLASVAHVLTGMAYPGERLAEAWKLVLFNQFHDTLAGTAIPSAYEDSRDDYGRASSIAAEVANLSIQRVGNEVAIPYEEDMVPLIVVNTLPWTVSRPVELELEGTSSADVVASGLDGGTVLCQRIQAEATVGGRHRRIALGVEVPPLGYRIVRLLPAPDAPAADSPAADAPAADSPAADAPAASRRLAGGGASDELVLDNGLLRVEVDPATGWLASLHDEALDMQLVPEKPGAHAVVVLDRSDTWGHDVERYDDYAGCFACTSVRRLEDGPVRSALRIESAFAGSTLVEDLILAAGARHLEVRVTLDWHERQRLLKLRFPAALRRPRATFSVPYGFIERACDGHEEPSQAWVDVSGELADGRPAGWSVINDAKYGHDVTGSEIGMTAARSPVYAWHDPKQLDPAARYDHLDQGEQRFSYGLVPHAGDWRRAGTVRLAEELNQPPEALPEHAHPGSLPPSASYGAVRGGSVLLSVLKLAEDGDGLIVRAVETDGVETVAQLELPLVSRRLHAAFRAGEIRTFRVPLAPGRAVTPVSLVEGEPSELDAGELHTEGPDGGAPGG
jgi:alpha-mannosidase